MVSSIFPLSAALLDAMVLAITEKCDSYGYQITKDIQSHVTVSESTLYPVLRRLEKNKLLEVYDMPYMGRNRRYYKITPQGIEALGSYRAQWREYVKNINYYMNNTGGEQQ